MNHQNIDTNCPFCQSDEVWLQWSDVGKMWDTDYSCHFVECQACTGGFLFPRPKPEQIPSFYPDADHYAPHLEKPIIEKSSATFGQRVFTKVAHCLDVGFQITPQSVGHVSTVLDIGCGAGRRGSLFVKAGAKVFGIEPSEVAAQRAREQGLIVHTGTLDGFDPAGVQFDLIYMWAVLEHVLDPVADMAAIRKLLAPSGKLIITVPNNDCLEARRFGVTWWHRDIPRHLNFFNRKSLFMLLERCGFSVTRHSWYGFERQFNPSHVPAIARDQPLESTWLLSLLFRSLISKRRTYDNVIAFAVCK